MQVSISSLTDVLHEAEITLSREELQPHLDHAYDKERTRIEIKGFRKGKAPLDLIKRMYGEAIEHDALDRVANDFYVRAMDERKISPIGQPAMIDMDYRRGEQFRFRIQYETRPEIALRDYKGIPVVRATHTVSDAEVDKEILRLRRLQSKSSPAEAVTDNEFVVTTDIQELDGSGTPIIGRKAKDVKFYLADETVSDEIKHSLAAAVPGGVYRVHFESTEDQKPATTVDLHVSQIEKIELPVFDDSFVSRLTDGKITSSKSFRERMKSDLDVHWKEWSDRRVTDSITNEVVQMHNFPVPEALVNVLLDSFLEDVRNRSQKKELPKDFDEEKFRLESRDLAIWQAKWMLLKDEIAEAENISIGESDLEEAAVNEAGKVGLPKERILEYYRKSSGAKEKILTQKIVSFLLSHARITESVTE
jgi:trigger factor